MSGLQMNSITGAGTAAASSVASVLVPKLQSMQLSAQTKNTSATGKTAQDTSSNTTSTDSTAGDITSSDFLTLLVSELKNQDPTQPTDPNAYITQLVGVNSLQQLISINQGLTSVETPTATTSAS